MTDIVERLRSWPADKAKSAAQIERDEAADEIERLRAALAPFAAMAGSYANRPAAEVVASKGGTIISVYDLRAAEGALG